MNDLTEFKFNNTILSVTMINDEPWFIAKDVCEHLDMKNPSESCSSLDEDEKLLSVIMIAGQRREVLHVSQSGLYALVVRSRKPSAKDFRKWARGQANPWMKVNYNPVTNIFHR